MCSFDFFCECLHFLGLSPSPILTIVSRYHTYFCSFSLNCFHTHVSYSVLSSHCHLPQISMHKHCHIHGMDRVIRCAWNYVAFWCIWCGELLRNSNVKISKITVHTQLREYYQTTDRWMKNHHHQNHQSHQNHHLYRLNWWTTWYGLWLVEWCAEWTNVCASTLLQLQT